jgi:TrmH family RNA methyltransferase
VIITSLGNTAIKQVRALHQRKERDRTGLCLAEGIRIVAEALQVGAPVETLVAAPELLRSRFAQDLVADHRHASRYLEVSARVFGSISSKEGPQGLAAVVRQRWEPLAQVRLGTDLCWIVLDGPQDPGNLGTIARTSDAVGGTGIMLLGESADPYDPNALRASMGAMLSQRLVRASRSEFVAWATSRAYPVVGTSDAAPTEYRAVEYRAPLLLLMGSERQGLAVELRALCDPLVRIPMVGRSDSLNLAVASSLVLYELFHQQRSRRSAQTRQ